MDLDNLNKTINYLQLRGYDLSDIYIWSEHDIIGLSWVDEPVDLTDLEEYGWFWDGECESICHST